MKTSFSRKQLGLAAACALAFGIMSGAVSAETLPVDQRAVVSGPAQMVWMNDTGLCWRSDFGPPPLPNTPCGPQPVAQVVAPAPVAQAAPAPAPVAAAPVAAPEPVIEKVSLNADTLFDFDKAILRPQGRDALDAFVGKLQGVELQTITAVGHTDRIGSERLQPETVESTRSGGEGLSGFQRHRTRARADRRHGRNAAGHEGRRMRGQQERHRVPAAGPSRRDRSERHPDHAVASEANVEQTTKSLHPLVWIAGIALIVFSAVGIGAFMGWIPTSMGGADDKAVLATQAANTPEPARARREQRARAGEQPGAPNAAWSSRCARSS